MDQPFPYAPFPIELSLSAREKIRQVLIEDGGVNMRVFVQGGGCSGFTYGFTIDDVSAEDDLIFDAGDFKIFIDPFSAPLLQGATIDYQDNLEGSRFIVKNPLATATCGCGSSFSV